MPTLMLKSLSANDYHMLFITKVVPATLLVSIKLQLQIIRNIAHSHTVYIGVGCSAFVRLRCGFLHAFNSLKDFF